MFVFGVYAVAFKPWLKACLKDLTFYLMPETRREWKTTLPEKNWTPMMLKISQNIMPTRNTLKMEGMARIREFTTICQHAEKTAPSGQTTT